MQIKLEIKGLKQLEYMLKTTAKELERAEVMAINKGISSAKTEMKRAISSEFTILQKTVNKRLKVTKARKGHAVAVLEPIAGRRGYSMNLIHFLEKKPGIREQKRRIKAEGSRPQLRFHIKRGAEKTIKGAFIGNRGRTVFKRTGKARLPIEPVQTIGVPGMFNTRRINERVIARIRKELPVEMESAVAQVIRKRMK